MEKNLGKLSQISPDDIVPNPENPRIIFRQEEMENLLVSISNHGIQVPIAVYKEKKHFVLIDGERRWRCAKKLNLKKIPTLVQEKPTALQNLLLMYNIHALREQWDYYTIASKLKRVMELFELEFGRAPNEVELSEQTGLKRGQIRRCHLLLDLPDRFQGMLLKELELPKSRQKLSEDFFIEMERSLKTVTKRLPDFADDIDSIRDTLVKKFRKGSIGAVTDFRYLSKIATAIKNLGIKKAKAERALNKIFDSENKVGIRDQYKKTVEFEYEEKNVSRQIENLIEFFDEILNNHKQSQLDKEFRGAIEKLYDRLKKLLGS